MRFANLLVVASLFIGFNAAAAPIGSITASWDENTYDSTIFSVTNTSAFALTNIVFTATPLPGTWNFGNVAAASTVSQVFNQGSGAFANEFEYVSGDLIGHNGALDVYSMTATWNSQTITASFSPTNNATGQFVGFLGQSPSGFDWELEALGVVAVLDDGGQGGAVPEPASLALLGAGFAGVALSRRKKAAKAI